MTRIVAINSFRRGVGKSNLTANLTVLLATQGHNVATLDMDLSSPAQQTFFGLTDSETKYTLNDFLWGNCEIEQAAFDLTPRLALSAPMLGRAYLLPASQRPKEIARVLRGDYYVNLLLDGFERLTDKLALDILLVDTHAGLTEDTLMIFGMTDSALLLLCNDQRDYQGTAVTVDVVRQLGMSRILLVVNELPARMDFDQAQSQVAQTYGCEVVGLLPHSDEIAALASQGIFALHYPTHPVTTVLRQIAARLML